jgi:hypothetical protein
MSDFCFSKKKIQKGFMENERLILEIISSTNLAGIFYKDEVNYMDDEVYKKSEEYWNDNRFENLSKDELGVYKC